MPVRERMLAAVPTRRERVQLAWLAAALVLLTALVAAGALTWLDQLSLDHAMPWLDPTQRQGNTSSGYWLPFRSDARPALKLLDVLTYPCSLLISGLVVAGAGAVLWRRGEQVTAALPIAAWVIGNGVEVIGKATITRPALYGSAYGSRVHVGAFDGSFPSGHMIRGVVIVFSILLVRRAAWPWLVLWAVLVAPALVVQASHTPTDVLGGAIVGVMLALGASILRRIDAAP